MAKRKSKINIKASREGTFTDWCKRQGYDVSDGVPMACIRKGLKSKDPRIRKKANFARNARKWGK